MKGYGDFMKDYNKQLKGRAEVVVSHSNCADAVKSGSLKVFSTPMLLALMEEASCNACGELMEDGETTVGTKMEINHCKASKLGSVITAEATLDSVEGRKLTFLCSAFDENNNEIATAVIQRFLVNEEKFMNKVNGL